MRHVEAINGLLEQLLAITERQRRWSSFFFPERAPKTAWILVPDRHMETFNCVHVYPEIDPYENVKRSHKPAIWQPDEVAKLDEELKRAKADLKGSALAQRESELRTELRKCASLTGYVYAFGGPRLFPHINLAENDNSYLELIPETHRETHMFCSGAGMPIQFAHECIAVLMLYDTLRSGFLGADAGSIGIFADLVAPFIFEGMRQGSF